MGFWVYGFRVSGLRVLWFGVWGCGLLRLRAVGFCVLGLRVSGFMGSGFREFLVSGFLRVSVFWVSAVRASGLLDLGFMGTCVPGSRFLALEFLVSKFLDVRCFGAHTRTILTQPTQDHALGV